MRFSKLGERTPISFCQKVRFKAGFQNFLKAERKDFISILRNRPFLPMKRPMTPIKKSEKLSGKWCSAYLRFPDPIHPLRFMPKNRPGCSPWEEDIPAEGSSNPELLKQEQQSLVVRQRATSPRGGTTSLILRPRKKDKACSPKI